LRKLCNEIQSSEERRSVISYPEKTIHYVVLEFPSTLNPIQCIYKAGRFVGRGGQHVKLLERTLNIRINILSNKSSKDFQQIVNKVQAQNKQTHINGLWVLITMKNNKDNIEQIKQSLQNRWEKVDVITKKKQSQKKIQSSEQVVRPYRYIFSDNRWKPKKQTLRDKQKNKEKQYDEQEVPPQPLVPPISMPKQIPKSRKTKRQ